jgi:serine/threonine protein kinase
MHQIIAQSVDPEGKVNSINLTVASNVFHIITIKSLFHVLEAEQICMLRDSVEDKKDLWLIYEVCTGKTMNEHLFEVKGEFYKGERIYMVHHSNFYHSLRSNLNLLKEFLYRMSLVLNLFAKIGIVHADLKPENILIEFDPDTQTMKSLKVIDLGSSFLLNE